MIRLEQIPEEVLRALCASMGCEWAMQDKEDQIILRRHIAAALISWPNSLTRDTGMGFVDVILPLKETPDGK